MDKSGLTLIPLGIKPTSLTCEMLLEFFWLEHTLTPGFVRIPFCTLYHRISIHFFFKKKVTLTIFLYVTLVPDKKVIIIMLQMIKYPSLLCGRQCVKYFAYIISCIREREF